MFICRHIFPRTAWRYIFPSCITIPSYSESKPKIYRWLYWHFSFGTKWKQLEEYDGNKEFDMFQGKEKKL